MKRSFSHYIKLALLVITAIFISDIPCHAQLQGWVSREGGPDFNRCVEDVVAEVTNLRARGDIMGFHMNNYDVGVCSHWQGVQRLSGVNSEYMVVPKSYPGEVALVKLDSTGNGRMGKRFRSNRLIPKIPAYKSPPPPEDGVVGMREIDEYYNHLGGSQAIGDWVAYSLEDAGPLSWNCDPHCDRDGNPNPAIISFWNYSDPTNPKRGAVEIELRDPETGLPITCSHAVAITKIADPSGVHDGKYLVMAGSGKRKLFYMSTVTSLEHWGLAFDYVGGFTKSTDGPWHSYQVTNFVNQCDGQIFLLGFYLADKLGPFIGKDSIDVWRVEMSSSGIDLVKALPERLHMNCDDPIDGSRQCNFATGSGIYVDPDGRLLVYATEHSDDGPGDTVKFMEFRSKTRPTSCTTIRDAWVELYEGIGVAQQHSHSVMIDFDDRRKENYWRFKDVEDFNDLTSSMRWCLPRDYRFVLFQNSCEESPNCSFWGDDEPMNGTGYLMYEPQFSRFGASSGRFEWYRNGEWEQIPRNVLAGMVYNGDGYYIPRLEPEVRYYLVDDAFVPNGETLNIYFNHLLFFPSTKLTSFGNLSVNGVMLGSDESPDVGIKVNGGIHMQNGGEIKIY